MKRYPIDHVARMLAARTGRRRILLGLGAGALGATYGRGRAAAQDDSCFGACGIQTGACHAGCGSDDSCHLACVNSFYGCSANCSGSAAPSMGAVRGDEQSCHDNCNATVAPGPELGACHTMCGLGSGG